jgi:hypothetical protein
VEGNHHVVLGHDPLHVRLEVGKGLQQAPTRAEHRRVGRELTQRVCVVPIHDALDQTQNACLVLLG